MPKATQQNQAWQQSFDANNDDYISKFLPTNIESIFGPPLEGTKNNNFSPPTLPPTCLAYSIHQAGDTVQLPVTRT